MKMQEIQNDEMCCLVAPDGTPQLSTLAPDFATCVGFCEAMAYYGLSKHPAELFELGFVVLPVKLTITQNGDENDAFQKQKEKNERSTFKG